MAKKKKKILTRVSILFSPSVQFICMSNLGYVKLCWINIIAGSLEHCITKGAHENHGQKLSSSGS